MIDAIMELVGGNWRRNRKELQLKEVSQEFQKMENWVGGGDNNICALLKLPYLFVSAGSSWL